MNNVQAVLPEAKAQVLVQPAAIPQPGEDEVLIRNEIISINPLESKLQKFAFFPLNYPANLGMSCAGIVEALGEGVTGVSKGDAVVVGRPISCFSDSRTGTNQQYLVAKRDTLAVLNSPTDLVQAAASISNLITAVAALHIGAGLDRPQANTSTDNTNIKVLIYGGSSQLGRLSIQFAKQAGYTVVTTSSPKNKDFVAQVEPAYITDHTGSEDQVVAELVSQGPFTAVFDAIGKAPAHAILKRVLVENKVAGGTATAYSSGHADGVPDGIAIIYTSFPSQLQDTPANAAVKTWFFSTYVPSTVSGGTFELQPTRTEKVAGGLAGLQSALDRALSLSGVKLVLDPWE